MSLSVAAPVAGRVLALHEVPDQVFAEGIVGPGLAVDPRREGTVTACAPVPGRILKAHPHAFVVVTSHGKGVLVHVGIDTVELSGSGFTIHVAEGDEVVAGTPVITFDPAAIADGGRSPICPVVALEARVEQIERVAGAGIEIGDTLFDLT